MKYGVLLMLLAATLTGGCASDSARRAKVDRAARNRRQLAPQTSFEASAGAREMGVENEMGVYDGNDIDEAIGEHMDEVRECYRRAGRAQRYAGGKVVLRFMVRGDGRPRDVLVIATDLGNYDVERCLVDVGRRVQFPAPDGNKATSFEFPVEFKSTHEMQVQDLDGSLKVDRDVAALAHSLSSCGRVAEHGVTASFYIEPNGMIGSVGLAAESPFDEQAGACIVREMRRWRMSASLPGRMLRCHVTIPPFIASAESSRPGALSASARRRHR